MKSLGEYQNRNGENFQLTLCDDDRTPSNADNWGYVLTVSHERWGKKRIRILIKKTIASNKDLADVLVLEEPMRHAERTIDTADAEGFVPLWPLSLDWFVFPESD